MQGISSVGDRSPMKDPAAKNYFTGLHCDCAALFVPYWYCIFPFVSLTSLSPTDSIVQRFNSFHFTFHGLRIRCDVAPVIT